MRAFWYDRAGPAADVLQQGELPDPEPGPGEVRVRIAYSTVNPTDVKRRSSGRELSQFAPIIPNHDGSGVIDKAGEYGWFVEAKPSALRWAISDAFTFEFSPIALDIIAPVTYGIPLVVYAFTTGVAVEWSIQ